MRRWRKLELHFLGGDLEPGSLIGEQVERYRVVVFTQRLFLLPGVGPDVAGHDVGRRLEVVGVQMYKFRRGRAESESTRREIGARETREVIRPAMPVGIDGQTNVAIMFQEGGPVPGKKSLPPP